MCVYFMQRFLKMNWLWSRAKTDVGLQGGWLGRRQATAGRPRHGTVWHFIQIICVRWNRLLSVYAMGIHIGPESFKMTGIIKKLLLLLILVFAKLALTVLLTKCLHAGLQRA